MKGHPFAPKIDDDHDCQVRRAFNTKDHAMAVADAIHARTGKNRPVERCKHCNSWHLGEAK